MSKIREFMNNQEIPEALRLFVVNSLARTTAYDSLFEPMMKGEPAIIRIDLLKRKQIRVTAAPDLSKQLEDEQADNRKLLAENMELHKDCDGYEKQISRLTADHIKAKEALKELQQKAATLEKEIKKLKQKKPVKKDEPAIIIDGMEMPKSEDRVFYRQPKEDTTDD